MGGACDLHEKSDIMHKLLEVLNVGHHFDDLRRKCGNYIKMTLAVREVVWESAN
jgi:hypothetical protein